MERKKIISLLLSTITALNMCACGDSISDGDKNYVKDGEEYVETSSDGDMNNSKDGEGYAEKNSDDVLTEGQTRICMPYTHYVEDKMYDPGRYDIVDNDNVYDLGTYKYYYSTSFDAREGYTLFQVSINSESSYIHYIWVNIEPIELKTVFNTKTGKYEWERVGTVVKENKLTLGD